MTLEELRDLKYEKVLYSMEEYLNYLENGDEDNDDEIQYSQDDIEECGEILDLYIDSLTNSNGEEEIMQAVEEVIGSLNELNYKTDQGLIETQQREDLAEYIQTAAVLAGLPPTEEDITEEWRDW